jgi:hypothetical protein
MAKAGKKMGGSLMEEMCKGEGKKGDSDMKMEKKEHGLASELKMMSDARRKK